MPKLIKVPFLGSMTIKDFSLLATKVIILISVLAGGMTLFFNLRCGYRDGKVFFELAPPETKININKSVK